MPMLLSPGLMSSPCVYIRREIRVSMKCLRRLLPPDGPGSNRADPELAPMSNRGGHGLISGDGAPAEQGHELAPGVAHLDVVDAAAAPALAFLRDCREDVTLARRLQELDARRNRQRDTVVAVAGVREGTVREREDEAAMADGVPVQHLAPDTHREPGRAGTNVEHADAERVRCVIPGVHRGARGAGDGESVGVVLWHGVRFPGV